MSKKDIALYLLNNGCIKISTKDMPEYHPPMTEEEVKIIKDLIMQEKPEGR